MGTRMMDSFLTWGLEEQQTPEHGKELPTSVKSEEELAKFTVDEHLSEVERTILFLNGGQIVQQKHAIANLPAVIRGRGRQAWDSIAVPLKAALNRLDTDCQIEAAEIFAQIAKERLMSPMDLQSCLLPTIVRNINKEKSEEETQAWMRALFELIPMLDKEVIKSEILSMALSKGEMEENINSRIICAHILGAIATYLTREEVERSFAKKCLAMCQDVEYQVRLAMCSQLGTIGRVLGRDSVLKGMLDELFELMKDEENQVRAAAFSALVTLLDIIPPDVRRVRVMPVLRDHMQPFDLDIVMQKCIARLFAQTITSIKGEMELDDPLLMYSCFKHLSSKADPELKQICAEQFPLVVKAAQVLSSNAFSQQFTETLYSYASDMEEEVRLATARHIYDVAKVIGKEACCLHLTRPLTRLLRDESPRVQAAVLPVLAPTLLCFGSEDSPRKQAALDEIVRALLDLEANSNRSWRLHANLSSAFISFHHIFSSDVIYENFLPMVLRYLSSSAAAVRPLAAEAVTCFLRYNKKDRQRAEIFLKLIRDHARGKGFVQRMGFADICLHVVRRFSSKFIKEWIFDLCLELLYDPVPNVRLQVTHVLPILKQTIRLPEDVDLLERLNNAISNSMTDNDRDVSVTARLINDTYKRTPVRMGGGVSMMDPSGGMQATYEAEDRRKETEETDFCFSPEDAKEIKAEIVQMSYKKKGAAGAGDAKSAINKRVGGPDAPRTSAPSGFGSAIRRDSASINSSGMAPGGVSRVGTTPRSIPIAALAGPAGSGNIGFRAAQGTGATAGSQSGGAGAAANIRKSESGPIRIMSGSSNSPNSGLKIGSGVGLRAGAGSTPASPSSSGVSRGTVPTASKTASTAGAASSAGIRPSAASAAANAAKQAATPAKTTAASIALLRKK